MQRQVIRVNHEPKFMHGTPVQCTKVEFSRYPFLLLVIPISSVLTLHYNAGHNYMYVIMQKRVKVKTLYLGGTCISNDNIFVPTLHYDLHEEVKPTNHSTNELEYLQVNLFSSWIVHVCSYTIYH